MQCAVYSVKCAVCSVQRAVCSVQCAVCSVHLTVCSREQYTYTIIHNRLPGELHQLDQLSWLHWYSPVPPGGELKGRGRDTNKGTHYVREVETNVINRNFLIAIYLYVYKDSTGALLLVGDIHLPDYVVRCLQDTK